MKKLMVFWEFVNGKKTSIGLVLHAGWFLTNFFFKEFTTSEESLAIHGFIGTITGVGLGHKVTKAVLNNNKKVVK